MAALAAEALVEVEPEVVGKRKYLKLKVPKVLGVIIKCDSIWKYLKILDTVSLKFSFSRI